MSEPTKRGTASVVSVRRYPVKSMMGEEVNGSHVTEAGLLGDRAYALIDCLTGKVASAKNPSKWAKLFEFSAVLLEAPRPREKMPAVRITLPDGATLISGQKDFDQILSKVLGREVSLGTTAPKQPSLEEYWPDMEGLVHRETVTEEAMPAGKFFDCAVIHLLTTATIDRLRELYPQGRFEARRFRPNIVMQAGTQEKSFIENEWIGRVLAIGEEVRLHVTGPCPRCVMTTLPQGDLPKDPGILRAAAQNNQAHVGVYANVVRAGTVRRGDPVRVE
jgi:uncharacterized protein YcbX